MSEAVEKATLSLISDLRVEIGRIRREIDGRGLEIQRLTDKQKESKRKRLVITKTIKHLEDGMK